MTIWLLLAAVVLIYIYVSYYYRYPTNTKVIHASYDTFNPALLTEKHPIILLNAPEDQTLFKYLPTKTISVTEQEWHKNKHKYALIKFNTSAEVYLLPAYKKLTPDETLLTVQMQPGYLLIVPFHWHYSLSVGTEVVGVDDYVTWMLP